MESDYGHAVLVTPGAACEGEYTGWEPDMSNGPVKDYIAVGRPRPDRSHLGPDEFRGRISFWMPKQGFTIELEEESREKLRLRHDVEEDPMEAYAQQAPANLLKDERQKLVQFFFDIWVRPTTLPVEPTYADIMLAYKSLASTAAERDPSPEQAEFLQRLQKARLLFVQRYQRTAWGWRVAKEPTTSTTPAKKERDVEPPASTVVRQFWKTPGSSARRVVEYNSGARLDDVFSAGDFDMTEYELWVVPPPPSEASQDDEDDEDGEDARRTRRRVGETEEARAVAVRRRAEHYATTEMEPIGLRLLLKDRFWQYPHFFRAGETTHVLLMPNRRRVFTLGISAEATRRALPWPPVNMGADEDQYDFARWGRVPGRGLDETWGTVQHSAMASAFGQQTGVDPTLSWTFLGFNDGTRAYPSSLLLNALAEPKFLTDRQDLPLHVWPETNVPMNFSLLAALAKAYRLKPWYGMFSDARTNTAKMPTTVESPLYFVPVHSKYLEPLSASNLADIHIHADAIKEDISWRLTANLSDLEQQRERIWQNIAEDRAENHLALPDDGKGAFDASPESIMSVLAEVADLSFGSTLAPLYYACTAFSNREYREKINRQMSMPGTTLRQKEDPYYMAGAALFLASPASQNFANRRWTQHSLAFNVCKDLGRLPEGRRASWRSVNMKQFLRGMAHGAAASFFGRHSFVPLSSTAGVESRKDESKAVAEFLGAAGFFPGVEKKAAFDLIPRIYLALLHPDIFNQFLVTYKDETADRVFIEEWAIIASSTGKSTYYYVSGDEDVTLWHTMMNKMWLRAYLQDGRQNVPVIPRFQVITVFATMINDAITSGTNHLGFLENGPLAELPMTDEQRSTFTATDPDVARFWIDWVAAVVSSPSRTYWAITNDPDRVAQMDARPDFAAYRQHAREHVEAVIPHIGTDNEQPDGTGATLATGLVVALTKQQHCWFASVWRKYASAGNIFYDMSGLVLAAEMVTLATLDSWNALMRMFYPATRFLLSQMSQREIGMDNALGGHWKFNITPGAIVNSVVHAVETLANRCLGWLAWKLLVKSGVGEYAVKAGWSSTVRMLMDDVGGMDMLKGQMHNFTDIGKFQAMVQAMKLAKRASTARWTGRVTDVSGLLRVPPHLRGAEEEWTGLVHEMRRRAAKCMNNVEVPPVGRARQPLLPEWELMIKVLSLNPRFGLDDPEYTLAHDMRGSALDIVRPTEFRSRPASLQDLEAPATFLSCLVKNMHDHPFDYSNNKTYPPTPFFFAEKQRYATPLQYYHMLNEGPAAHFGLPGYTSVERTENVLKDTSFGGVAWGTTAYWTGRWFSQRKQLVIDLDPMLFTYVSRTFPLPLAYTTSNFNLLWKYMDKMGSGRYVPHLGPLFDYNRALSDWDKLKLLDELSKSGTPMDVINAGMPYTSYYIQENILSIREAVRLRWTTWAKKRDDAPSAAPDVNMFGESSNPVHIFVMLLAEFLYLTKDDAPLRAQLIDDCTYDPWNAPREVPSAFGGVEEDRALFFVTFVDRVNNESDPDYAFFQELRAALAMKRALKR